MSDLRIRASSFGDLFDCAHRWEGVHLLGMRLPSSPRALLGTGIHGGTAAFDKATLAGSPITIADAVTATIDTMRERELEEGVAWTSADPTRREVEKIALTLTTTYCRDVAPTFEFTAVELTTKELPIDVGGGDTVTLTGQLDRARIHRTLTRGKGLEDVKSGTRILRSDGTAKVGPHRAQLGTYELLYTWTTGEELTAPAGIIGLSTAPGYRVGFGQVVRPRDLLTGVHGNKGLLHYAAEMLRSGSFMPNPKSSLCSERYCPRWNSCAYHE